MLRRNKNCIILESGHPMPLFGLGTWNLRGKECTEIVQDALVMGYKLIDTAHAYENHEAVGEAIQDIPRERVFLTSKLYTDKIDKKHVMRDVQKSCDLALKQLQTDYLDLFLIHWPDRKQPHTEILAAMHECRRAGKVKSVGVSNFTIHHLKDLLNDGVVPHVNQVEFHPYLYQKDLWEFCEANKIALQSYRPLGKGELLKEQVFIELAEKHDRTPAQIILRWLIQKGIPTIAKASSQEHLRENLEAFSFLLTEAEMKKLDTLGKEVRFCSTDLSDFEY
ncbi:MAG: aldo/keto reductase [Chlamydiales bacterium]